VTKGINEVSLQDFMNALLHPVRREMLRLAIDQGEITVREAAKHLGEPLGTIRYHVQVLVRNNALEAGAPRLVRGSLTGFWRPTLRLSNERWAREVLCSER